MTGIYIALGIVALLGGGMVVQNTRTPELGVTNGQLEPVPRSDNAVSTQTDDPGKRVDPLPFRGSLEETRRRILDAVQAYGGARIVNDQERYIRLLFVTPRMRFRDDAEFLFEESAGLVHFRSASRVGQSDLGLNRRRYEAIADHYRNAP